MWNKTLFNIFPLLKQPENLHYTYIIKTVFNYTANGYVNGVKGYQSNAVRELDCIDYIVNFPPKTRRVRKTRFQAGNNQEGGGVKMKVFIMGFLAKSFPVKK